MMRQRVNISRKIHLRSNINSSLDGISLDELYKVLNEALIEYGESGIHGRKFLPKEHEVVTFLHD